MVPPGAPFLRLLVIFPSGALSLLHAFPCPSSLYLIFLLQSLSLSYINLAWISLPLESLGHTAWLSMPLVRILQNLGLLWYSFFFGPTWHTVLFSYCSFGLIPLTSYKSVDKPVPAPPVALGSSGHSAASTDWESIDHCCESEACFFLHLSDDRFSHKPFSFTHENIFLLKTVFSILFCPTDRFTWINI